MLRRSPKLLTNSAGLMASSRVRRSASVSSRASTASFTTLSELRGARLVWRRVRLRAHLIDTIRHQSQRWRVLTSRCHLRRKRVRC